MAAGTGWSDDRPDRAQRVRQVHPHAGPRRAGRIDDGVVRAHPSLAPHGERSPRHWDTVELARAFAWVPQWSSSTIVARTVLDEVMTTARAVGLVETEARARASALLDLLGLGHLLHADPRHLSGGEQRRLAMAAAVVHQPALLLADEATVGQAG